MTNLTELNTVREQAVACAARNRVMGVNIVLDPNYSNSANGDVVIGHLDNP